jgi:aspartate ammonia-lyase
MTDLSHPVPGYKNRELVQRLRRVRPPAAAGVPCKASSTSPSWRSYLDSVTKWGHDKFVVDVLQGGVGTSTNMNANEVIANRALELLGHRLGEYRRLDPIEHVNLGQSTNDVYPTALRLALRVRLGELRRVLATLRESLLGKGMEFGSVVKMGRTQLQEAIPMALRREFAAFGITFRDDLARLDQVSEALAEVNLGGTAINAHPK